MLVIHFDIKRTIEYMNWHTDSTEEKSRDIDKISTSGNAMWMKGKMT